VVPNPMNIFKEGFARVTKSKYLRMRITNQNYVHKALKRGLPLGYACEYLTFTLLCFLIAKK
jgi:hypothetical protein